MRGQQTAEELRDWIERTLRRLSKRLNLPLYSEEVVLLLLMIAAHESLFGKYREQEGGGPALGIFQIEKETLRDLYENYLKYRQEYRAAVDSFIPPYWHREDCLRDVDDYAVAVARMLLWRKPEPIPKESDFANHPEPRTAFLLALADYAKKHWNTHEGAATPEKYLRDYLRLI